MVYRRSEAEMPAPAEEAKHAKQEGIEFLSLTNLVAFLDNKDGFIEALRCIKMELDEPDASGRRSPKPIPGSEFEMPIQVAIIALGTGANPWSNTPLATSRRSAKATSRPVPKSCGRPIAGSSPVVTTSPAGPP
jgi:glutamate synthase (NADPH/NADH) small chain